MQHQFKQADETSVLSTPEWFKALTLAERLSLSQCRAFSAPDQPGEQSPDIVRWLALFGADEERFQQRLVLDNLSPALLLALLDESGHDLQTRAISQPAWLQHLQRAFQVHADALQETLEALREVPAPSYRRVTSTTFVGLKLSSWGITDFLTIINPVLSAARAHLREKALTLVEIYARAPFDPKTIDSLFLSSILAQLSSGLSRTMALELNVARLRGQLQGETPQQRLESFTRRLQQPEVALSLLAEYPVLARYLVTCIEQWLQHSISFLERLCSDWDDLCIQFASKSDPGSIALIEPARSVYYQGPGAKLFLTFTSGLRIVYKPRPLGVEQHFQQLLQWLNEQGLEPDFRPLRLLVREAYGWCEFVETKPCQSDEQIRRFHERQGAYLALLHILQATGFHFEHCIAHGEYPILVDLETLFHPRTDEILGTEKSTREAITTAQQHAQPIYALTGANSDSLRFTRENTLPAEQVQHGASPEMPTLSVEQLAFQQCGCERMYRFLQSHAKALLREMGPLTSFFHDQIRVVLRPVHIYPRLLQESLHPTLLRNALHRDYLFDYLWRNCALTPDVAAIIAAERADLHRGVRPFFVTHINSRDLFTSQGKIISHILPRSGWEEVCEHLRHLDEKDMHNMLETVLSEGRKKQCKV